MTGMEQLRVALLQAEARSREAMVPQPQPQPYVPGHEAELLSAHEGRPTVAEQRAGKGMS